VLSPSRAIAFDILLLVERGGYATDLLASRAAGLESRDAGLAEAIVLGSLRRQGQLDFLIGHYAGRAAAGLDAEVRIALRMGIYQMRYLERVPAHAAVSESVELVRRARKRSAAGLVNAVLRKAGREPIAWPDRSTELCHPEWLLERWDRQYGVQASASIARATWWRPKLTCERPARAGTPGTTGHRSARLLPVAEREARGLRIQDIGSQTIVPLLDLQAGQTFLDLTAAPGNKTAQALEAGVRTVACDRYFKRLAPMKSLGCDLVVLDGSQPLPFRARFDRILLDAPCSGTGTLARNPEIKWRLRPSDITGLAAKQASLLANALERLAPGGRLVYSTCSLEREENEGVVEQAGAPVVGLFRRLPGRDAGDGFFAAVITSG